MVYRKILLIDDDIEDQEIFRNALLNISNDFEFISITDSKNALDKLIAKELKPDIIFLDLNMPIVSGEEFLIKLKANNEIKGLPIIIFSTTSNPISVLNAKEIGALDFITKPDRFDKLVTLLKNTLS